MNRQMSKVIADKMVLNSTMLVDLLWIIDIRHCDTVKTQYFCEKLKNCTANNIILFIENNLICQMGWQSKKIFNVMIIVKNAVAITFIELSNVMKPPYCND